MSEPTEPDYSKMSVEEMDKLDFVIPNEPPPEPKAEPSEPVVPEEPKTPEPEPKKEGEPEPIQEEDDLSLALKEAEARAKHFESVAGRHGGEIRFLKEKLNALESQRRAEPLDDTEPDASPAPRPSPKRDSIAAWAVQQAVSQSAAGFARSHPDASEIQQDMETYLKQSGYDASSILLSEDPVEAAKETQRVLEEAYWHARAARTSKLRSEAQTRRADQMRAIQEAKKLATPSGAGGVAPAPAQPKRDEDLTAAEADAKLEALYGRNRRR